MQRVKFIYNPSSGETLVADRLDDIIALYQKKGYSIVPYRLTFEGSPRDMVGDLDHTYHHVLVAGGDGTVNYVVNMLRKHKIDIPLAVLPAGTANDFAAMLGLPSDIMKAARKNLAGTIGRVDLGVVNNRYFVNVFSCGLFSDISQKTPTIFKNTFGKLAYYVGGMADLPKFRRLRLEITSDGGDFRGNSMMFLVFNGRVAGGFRVAPTAELDDGKLDVVILTGDNPLETIRTVFMYLGRTKKYPPGVIHLQCTKLTARCETDEPTDVDGQAGPPFPLHISCSVAGQRMLLPRKKNG